MKILIADPHPEVRSALRMILERYSKVSSICEAGSLAQLLAQCAQLYPDLILLDQEIGQLTRMPPHPLASLLDELKHLSPGSRVVLMSSRFGAEREALEAGASGFISKTDAPDEVLTGIARFLENRS